MTKIAISSEALPATAGPYTPAIISNGFVFTSGFGPHDPETGQVAAGIEEQTAQVLRNIQVALSEAGMTMDSIVKSTVHLENLKRDFNAFNATYEKFFQKPYPVRTTVGADLYDVLVEIDVVAELPIT